MKKLVTLFALTFFLVAFTPVGNTPTKEKNTGKALLDKVVSKAKSYKNMVIDFKYAINNTAENINQENKGTIVLQGNKYVLSFMMVRKFTLLFQKMRK